jgi:tripartite-type tricarboxylate transporter receptor subunit TctC
MCCAKSCVLREILAKPRILQRIADIGLEAQWSAPEEFAERIRADVKLWAAITKEAGTGRQ